MGFNHVPVLRVSKNPDVVLNVQILTTNRVINIIIKKGLNIEYLQFWLGQYQCESDSNETKHGHQ